MKSTFHRWIFVFAFGIPVPIGILVCCEVARGQTGLGLDRISSRPIRDTFPMRDNGTVAILKNGSVMEGSITREGSQYRIRFQVGEIQLPVERVNYVCQDWDEALEFMKRRANLRDPDERLRLASWCHQYRLYDRAIEEANEGLRLRPNHPPTKQLLRMVQQAQKLAHQATNRKPNRSVVPPTPELDLNAESMRQFTTSVQPVLMNACAKCHAGHRGGSFRLFRNHGSGLRSRRATRHNLNVVIQHLNLDRPELSPLLIKSVSRHARNLSTEPIKSRKAEPYRRLKHWVTYVIENNPHLPGRLAKRAEPGSSAQPTSQRVAGVSNHPRPIYQPRDSRPTREQVAGGSSFGTRGNRTPTFQQPQRGSFVRGATPTQPQVFAESQQKGSARENVAELFPKRPTPPATSPPPTKAFGKPSRMHEQQSRESKTTRADSTRGATPWESSEPAERQSAFQNAYDPRQWNLRMHPRMGRQRQTTGGR
ncbi:MAG: tetratricopeptide repeat protein [Gemmataceae bacterium]